MISSDLQDYLNNLNTEKRSVQRFRLTIEEILLNILTHFGNNTKISVGIGKHFGQHIFRLFYKTELFDPSKSSEHSSSDDIMRSLGLVPAWNYRGKTNMVSLVLADRPKRSTLFYIFLAVVFAVIMGEIGHIIPENVRLIINDSVLSPISNSFLGLLSTFAGLMIFLNIISGILDIGNTATLEGMGKSIITRFIAISFIVCTVSFVIIFPFFNFNFSTVSIGQVSVFEQIIRMFFDILPTNIIEPFKTGNTFQIIVIAIFIGCGLLAIEERGKNVRSIINESSILFKHIVSSVCAVIPVYIFSMLLKMIWSGQLSMLISVLKPIIMINVLSLIEIVIFLIISSFRLNCPPLLLMKKVLPTFLVAFFTASSVAALPLGMETCEKKLGIKKSMISFVYPLGSVIYMPVSIIFFTVLVCGLAEIYQVAVSVYGFL